MSAWKRESPCPQFLELQIILSRSGDQIQGEPGTAGQLVGCGLTGIDLGVDAAAFKCDVLDKLSLIEARDAVTTKFGSVDALVNGAGGNHPKASTEISFLEPEAYAAGSDRGLFDVDYDGFWSTFDLKPLDVHTANRLG